MVGIGIKLWLRGIKIMLVKQVNKSVFINEIVINGMRKHHFNYCKQAKPKPQGRYKYLIAK